MAFHVGQKVVTIKSWHDLKVVWPQATYPVEGVVYTIRGLEDTIHGPGLFLNEIINPIWLTDMGTKESSFDVVSFRPLVSTKTDISIFTAMLGPKQRERIDEQA